MDCQRYTEGVQTKVFPVGGRNMAEILETIMLICFGCSWPISVMKNIRAKTAKSTSLGFILLILTGYIAGIAAKIYTHRINYVLLVYLFNLLSEKSFVIMAGGLRENSFKQIEIAVALTLISFL